MPLVNAWKCPYTGKLFDYEDEAKYKSHVNEFRREKKRNEKRNFIIAQITEERNNILSVPELEEWIMNNILRLFSVYKSPFSTITTVPKDFKFSKFEFSVEYKSHVSNSHSAPVGKLTNWYGSPSKPTGYPAYQGQLRYEYEGSSPSGITDVLTKVGIHTGTGSSGGRQGSYEVKLWLEDWPGLSQAVIAEKLRGPTTTAYVTFGETDSHLINGKVFDKNCIATITRSSRKEIVDEISKLFGMNYSAINYVTEKLLIDIDLSCKNSLNNIVAID